MWLQKVVAASRGEGVAAGIFGRAYLKWTQYWGCRLMRLLLEVVVLLMTLLQVFRSGGELAASALSS